MEKRFYQIKTVRCNLSRHEDENVWHQNVVRKIKYKSEEMWKTEL